MSEIIYLKTTEVKALREKLHNEQDMICPICKHLMSHDAMALDHQHKLFKNQPLLEDGAGLVRGVICLNCNSWEGKVSGSFKRMGLHKKDSSMSDMLRNLADYLDRENLPYVHPNEVPKAPKLGKAKYNKIIKIFKELNPNKKVPEYPKSGNVTKLFEELSELYGVPL